MHHLGGPCEPRLRDGERTHAGPGPPGTLGWRLWPRQATGDTTYGAIENIKGLEGDGIRAFVPLPDYSRCTGYLSVEVFTYDDANDRYICPQSQELRLIETRRHGLYNLDSPKLFYPR